MALPADKRNRGRRSRSRATPKSLQRREEIVKAATAVFDRQGYANTSLDDIARSVGITREGIYYYFDNRAEILLAIIRPQSIALIEGLREIVASERDDLEKLRLAVRNHLERFDRHCLEMTVSLRDGYLEDSGEVGREMNQIWKKYERMWTRLIRDGQRTGGFRKAGDPKMLAFGILGMCNWLARWYDPAKSVSIDDIIDSYFGMIGFGLIAADDAGRDHSSGKRRSGPGASG